MTIVEQLIRELVECLPISCFIRCVCMSTFTTSIVSVQISTGRRFPPITPHTTTHASPGMWRRARQSPCGTPGGARAAPLRLQYRSIDTVTHSSSSTGFSQGCFQFQEMLTNFEELWYAFRYFFYQIGLKMWSDMPFLSVVNCLSDRLVLL